MRGFLGNRSPLVINAGGTAPPVRWCASRSPLVRFLRATGLHSRIMHDIGRLGLLKSYPQESALVLGGDYRGEKVLDAECKALGVDHAAPVRG